MSHLRRVSAVLRVACCKAQHQPTTTSTSTSTIDSHCHDTPMHCAPPVVGGGLSHSLHIRALAQHHKSTNKANSNETPSQVLSCFHRPGLISAVADDVAWTPTTP